jgi:hypothetical protein
MDFQLLAIEFVLKINVLLVFFFILKSSYVEKGFWGPKKKNMHRIVTKVLFLKMGRYRCKKSAGSKSQTPKNVLPEDCLLVTINCYVMKMSGPN